MTLILHRGGKEADFQDLGSIKIPMATRSYQPIPHQELASYLKETACALLNDFRYLKSQYGLARDGQQMFGVHTFHNGRSTLGLSIGFRNSYDRTLAVGIVLGASVFVCDNLALSGDITLMRKHTRNMLTDLESMSVTAILKARTTHHRVVEDADELRRQEITDVEAFSMIGLLFGKEILAPRQLPIMKREWLEPVHDEFKPRSAWSLYNAATEALKSCPPNSILERHLALHGLFKRRFIEGQVYQDAA